MLSLNAKIRQEFGKKVKSLRKRDVLPAVIYGPKVKAAPLEIAYKDFEKVYREAGESSLIKLEIENSKKESIVLIHEIEKDPFTEKFIHVDFYQPPMDKEITASVTLVFAGEALAVKELGGTLVRNIQELEIKALPLNLPHQISVNIDGLKTFEDNIFIKDLVLPEGVRTLRSPEEIVALVTPPEKIEEELAKPVEEKVEEVGIAQEKKREEEPAENES